MEPVSEFGQRLAVDFIIFSKSHKSDQESVVLVIRDEFSGYINAYPCSKRSSDFVVKSLRAFLGPSYNAHPASMGKTNCVPELQAACNVLGLIHEPTFARRWPHNSVIEREIRTLEELARASHLGAGFHIVNDLWPHSVQYASTVMNAYHPIKDADGNQHNYHLFASGKEFEGRQLILGQLIYVRKDPLNRHKFDANAEEVYVPPGDPIIPLQVAAEAALADFSDPSLGDYLPKEGPFSSLPSDASPAVRHEYITFDRITRFGATPDCKA